MLRVLVSIALALTVLVSCGETDGDGELSSADGLTPSSDESSTTTSENDPEPSTTDDPDQSAAHADAASDADQDLGEEATGEISEEEKAFNGLLVVILASAYGVVLSEQDTACVEDSGFLEMNDALHEDPAAVAMSALTTCTPEALGDGLGLTADSGAFPLSDELRCYFPEYIGAASGLSAEDQIEFFSTEQLAWDTPLHEEAATACDLSPEDLAAVNAEFVAITASE